MSRIKKMLRLFIDTINTPTIGGTWYMATTIAIGHVFLGAVLAGIVWPFFLAACRIFIPISYWLAKEREDLKRGGSWSDGVIDAVFVALGSLYGMLYWIEVVVICVGLFVLYGLWKDTKEA